MSKKIFVFCALMIVIGLCGCSSRYYDSEKTTDQSNVKTDMTQNVTGQGNDSSDIYEKSIREYFSSNNDNFPGIQPIGKKIEYIKDAANDKGVSATKIVKTECGEFKFIFSDEENYKILSVETGALLREVQSIKNRTEYEINGVRVN